MIKNFIKDKILHPIKSFFRRIVRICQYMPILWNNHDYDYQYILELLKYKIERTRKFIEKKGMHLHKDTDIKDMLKAEELLSKIINHNFDEDLKKAHDNKWGKREMIFKRIEGSEYSEIHFIAEKANTIEERKKERDEYYQLIQASMKREKETYEELFSLLRDKIQNWWD